MKEGYYSIEKTSGFLLKKLPKKVHIEIKNVVDTIQEDFTKAVPLNYGLEGQINKEYECTLPKKTTYYITDIVNEYILKQPPYLNLISGSPTSPPKFKYKGHAWVNFQEKYEYNPLHNHVGVFSFVIWYQIPFLKKDEIIYGAGRDRGDRENHNGQFEFMFPIENKIVNMGLPIDKTMEGYMVMFPSNLQHCVYPFYTSDDYRITLSGNIHFDS